MALGAPHGTSHTVEDSHLGRLYHMAHSCLLVAPLDATIENRNALFVLLVTNDIAGQGKNESVLSSFMHARGLPYTSVAFIICSPDTPIKKKKKLKCSGF